MIDEYFIISLNDDRRGYKANIRQKVKYPETFSIQVINGTTDKELIKKELKRFKIPYIWDGAKYGELGIWLTILNICVYSIKTNKTILTFEDDAIVESSDIGDKLDSLLKECPEDMDLFSVLVPINQMIHAYMEWVDKEGGLGMRHPDIAPSYDIGKPRVCRAYQGFSFVSVIYTPRGAARLLNLVRRYGLTGPVDTWAFEQHEQRLLNIYTPKPSEANMVTIDGATETTIHNTGRFL